MVFFPKFFGFFNGRLRGEAAKLKKSQRHAAGGHIPRKNREYLQMPRYFVWCSCKAWWSQFDSILVPWISWWLDEPWFKATGFKGTPLKPKLLTSYHDTRSTSGLLQILVGHTLLAIKRYKKWLMGHIYYGSGNPCYWHAIFHAILYMYMPKLGRNDFV